MLMSKSSKMLQFVNYRMRVTIQDGRQLVGNFMAFDRHMNLVLGNCEEFRNLPLLKGNKKEDWDDSRTFGLVLLRGEEVVSMIVEGPPPQEESCTKATSAAPLADPSIGRVAGRVSDFLATVDVRVSHDLSGCASDLASSSDGLPRAGAFADGAGPRPPGVPPPQFARLGMPQQFSGP
ncbi:hypothetical protein ACFX13_034299 [Malus domestica]